MLTNRLSDPSEYLFGGPLQPEVRVTACLSACDSSVGLGSHVRGMRMIINFVLAIAEDKRPMPTAIRLNACARACSMLRKPLPLTTQLIAD